MAVTKKKIIREKLTKKFLFGLPTNSYIVSNVILRNNKPIYENKVVALSKRESQWSEIKQVSANNRLCYAFDNKLTYKEWKFQPIEGNLDYSGSSAEYANALDHTNQESELFGDSIVPLDNKTLTKFKTKLDRFKAEIENNSTDKHVMEISDHLYREALNKLYRGDIQSVKNTINSMEGFNRQLKTEYMLRIVSRPKTPSGIWRHSKNNPNFKIYYIIVEAIAPDGKLMALPVTDEENGETSITKMWGIRVPESVFNQIKRDKKLNGKINNNQFGVKHRGHLTPHYLYPIEGGMITKW